MLYYEVMPSIDSIKASDGSANASIATVQSTRSGGATTIDVDTVSGIPAFFHATMGTPHTFTDPITSETITIISETTAVDFEGHVDGSDLEIDTIAPGYTDGGSEVGDIVIIRPTTQWADNVAAVLEAAHDDDGTLSDGAVDATGVLADSIVSNAKLKTGSDEPGGVWNDWTPSYANITVGNGTVVAKYKKVGRTVHFHFQLIAGSTTSIANGITISLPVTAAARYGTANTVNPVGKVTAADTSALLYPGDGVLQASTADLRLYFFTDTTTRYTSTFPFTEAAGDALSVSGTYEAAS